MRQPHLTLKLLQFFSLLLPLSFAPSYAHGGTEDTTQLTVDCAPGVAAAPSSPSYRTLDAAASALAAIFAASDAAAAPRPRVRVLVRGACAGPLVLTAAHSGPVEWLPAPPALSWEVTGGAALPASWFVPVTDAAVLAQLPPAARPFVRALDLGAHGLDAGPGVIGGRGCRAYAEGLPEPHGGSMPGAAINSPPGLELFAATGGGAVAPLQLARFPNDVSVPALWSKVLHSTPSGPANRTLGPDLPTLARGAAWAQQFAEDAGSIFVHEYSRVGWADMHWPLVALTPHNFTFGGCGNMSVGEHAVQTGNYFYSYNILAELDSEGEYYVNRTARVLYAWLPAAGAGEAVAGYASLLEAPLLNLTGVSGHAFTNASLRYGRGAGLSCVDCAGVSFAGLDVAMVGLMAANVSGGANVTLAGVRVADTGNGGVYFYAGDRVALAAAGHAVLGADITRYNRWTHCYTPGVVLGGVGNRVAGARIYGAPHQAIFLSGNEHTIADCAISDVTRITADSGAVYAGRDLTYRGNRILRTAFSDLQSAFPGTPAIYADDCVSSFAVVNCTFRNCSGPAAALEGGKGHAFAGNYVHEDARGVHAVGKSCAGALPYLAAVPWNTSAAWRAAYPELASELAPANVNAPWHLAFANNTLCAPRANGSAAAPFVDMAAATVQRYNGSDDGGANACGHFPAAPWTGAPVRGFNSWTAFGCGVTDADLRATADALASTGLARIYTFVGVDDCVFASRSANGTLVPDAAAFPYGIAPLAAYVRSRGLGFAMYASIGNTTCAGRPGSAGWEAEDAALFASWGVVWLKADNCHYPGIEPAVPYAAWAAALDALPYRIPVAGKAVLNSSAAHALLASRRVGGDVSASWSDLWGLALMAEPLWRDAVRGDARAGTTSFATDIELVQVGNGGLSADEAAAHFWIWCALQAPLVLSTRIDRLPPADVALLSNAEALAVQADASAAPARRLAVARAPGVALAPALAPMALACSQPPPAVPAPGQRWQVAPPPAGAPAGAFSLLLLLDGAPTPEAAALQRASCAAGGGGATVVAAAAAACGGGLGAAWRWRGGAGTPASPGLLESAHALGGCLTLEPRVALSGCDAGAPYQTLTLVAATGQLAMNFTGSGARGDYTGYAQCVDARPDVHVEVWASRLADGSLAVLALNPTNSAAALNVTVNATALGGALPAQPPPPPIAALKAARDVGARADLPLPAKGDGATLVVAAPPHGARFLRLTPA
jgi:hypothetical protein